MQQHPANAFREALALALHAVSRCVVIASLAASRQLARDHGLPEQPFPSGTRPEGTKLWDIADDAFVREDAGTLALLVRSRAASPKGAAPG